MRDAIANLPGSKIRELANSAIGRDDVLAFWFGESDEVTPEPIREAAIASLRRGETFYASNLGLPELREAIARYVGSLHGACEASRIAVTSSGVSGLMIAMQMLAGPGDEVVAVVPVWPNVTAQPEILGARVKRVSLVVRTGAWTLDLDALLAAITDRTRVLVINAPNNPTGWTLTRDEQRAILAHCRQTGTWILADEVYERLYFEAEPAAPSFLDIAEPDDRLVVANSFSKCFLMTGWRLGWLVLPERLTTTVSHLIEFNTSCAPVFVQRGGLAALAHAEELIRDLRAHTKVCRDTLVPQLMALPGVQLCTPRGGMYAFFRIAGHDDSFGLAKRLVTQGIGLAPGVAFGDEGEGWLRWCFASRDPARLTRGVERLAAALESLGR
jgi:aspartate/methionine/tyrosine aminotransferase